MSEPPKIDITSLSSEDELSPLSSTDDARRVARNGEQRPRIDDNERNREDADEGHHPQESGVANPAFVPDDSFDDADDFDDFINGLPGSSASSQLTYCGDGAMELNAKDQAHEIPTLPAIAVEDMAAIRQTDQGRSQSLSISDHDSWLDSDRGSFIVNRIQSLVEAFANRAQRIKESIVQPPTPSPSPPLNHGPSGRPRLQSLIHQEDESHGDDSWLNEQVDLRCCMMRRRYLPSFTKVLDPQSKLYISWLFFVMVAYVYNAWVITLRAVFPYQNSDNLPIFLTFDYISDLIYVMDIALFKVRLQFLHDGFWVDDPEKTRKNYFKKAIFKMDLLALLPLDVLYFVYGSNPLFRLPRLLKIQTFWEFFHRVDAVAKTPYVIRIIRTLLYMMYLIHLNACAYYAMSIWEGIESNKWVFQGEGNAYIRCFYFATKTATSIGKNPKPENEYEYVFMTISWLMGVFIFAFLIGQIRDIVATATQTKTQYRQLMDQTVMYMRNLNLPEDLQRRVRLWLNHTWEQQKTLNESGILDSLPRKMKTDVAINVHYNTLVKVQLFKDCDKALLRDLVLQLKPVLFLPGDFICRKGEVGKEMYIVNKGLVQVTGGEHGDLVLATLSEGSVFGEISLLGIPGCNRRTADVRSQGFSNLFVLSKDDLWEALKNYPEAQKVLKKKAKSLIKENEERDKANKNNNNEKVEPETIIQHGMRKPSTPRLFKTVMQVVPPDSVCAQLLTRKPSVNTIKQHPNNNHDESNNRTEPLMRTQSATNSPKDDVTQKSKKPENIILSSPSAEKQSKNYINEEKQMAKKATSLPSPNLLLPPGDIKISKFVVVDDCRDQKNESSAPDEDQIKRSSEDTKDFIKSILHLIPGEFHVKGDKRRQNTVHPVQRNPECNDVKVNTANCSEDSGISVDMKVSSCSNHQPSHQAMEDPDDSFSTGDSDDSELSTSTRRTAHESSVNEDIDIETSKNDHSNEWMSPSTSVLSLRSLFRTNSSRASSIAQKDLPTSPTQTDVTDPYRPGSITSGSSSAGYDNLAFVPVDVLSSRRSSMFSDETSC